MKHILTTYFQSCSPYIFLVFLSVAPFSKRFSGPKDLSEKQAQFIETMYKVIITGDRCTDTHLFSKGLRMYLFLP